MTTTSPVEEMEGKAGVVAPIIPISSPPTSITTLPEIVLGWGAPPSATTKPARFSSGLKSRLVLR